MKKYAIIVAGGSGSRMQSEIPKQFLEIEGKPIVVHTIEKFTSLVDQIILVLPKDHIDYWTDVKSEYLPKSEVLTALGGATRTESVRNGLDLISDDGLVAIHDAVRPYISRKTIEDSFESAEKYGSGIAAVPMKDSIRERVAGGKSKARNREHFSIIQTPQTFQVSLIKEAFRNCSESQTDDATIYEMNGGEVKLVEGDYGNIKITTKEDLK